MLEIIVIHCFFIKNIYKSKKRRHSKPFRVCCAVSFWLVISVPLGDTFGAFDASLDVREDQHDVVQLIG